MAKSSRNRWALRDRLEAFGLRVLFGFLAWLPLDWASALGGLLMRTAGPLLSAHRVAVRNLSRALPELDASARKKILAGMWDNLGRSIGELPHLRALLSDPARVEVSDPAGLAARLRDDGKGALLVSAHFGNWELCPVPAMRFGFDQVNFYRPANNPEVDRVIQELRRPLAPRGFLPKGREGVRKVLPLLREGVHIGMLVDQKENDGIEVAFFGRPAMTTEAPALLALRLGLPIGLDMVERLDGARFRVHVREVTLADSGDRTADIAATTERINQVFEEFIRRRPDLWLWAHRRWKDEKGAG